MTEEQRPRCVFIYDQVSNISYPTPSEVEDHRHLMDHLFREGGLLSDLFSRTIKRRHERLVKEAQSWMHMDLGLENGDWVQVRPMGEIQLTLDGKGACRGLSFMPEMEQYCGRRLRVHKRVQKIMLESTGELRKLSIPTVLLEGAACDGSAHQGCDRCCPCFWREQWLKRVP